MPNYRLIRVMQTERGVFGVLTKPDYGALCCTLERPWENNARNISCIPGGFYDVVKHHGRKYKDVWRLLDVPDRSGILFHAGNRMEDSQGCILVGERFWKDGVLDSKIALNMLRDLLPDEFSLEVTGLNI